MTGLKEALDIAEVVLSQADRHDEYDTIRTALAEQEAEIARLRALLWALAEPSRALYGSDDDPRMGWCGHNNNHPTEFKCEGCGAVNDDCLLIEHASDCRVIDFREALLQAETFLAQHTTPPCADGGVS